MFETIDKHVVFLKRISEGDINLAAGSSAANTGCSPRKRLRILKVSNEGEKLARKAGDWRFRAIFVPLDGETAAQEFLPGRGESIAFSGKVCYNAKERKIAKYFSIPDFRERK